MKKKKKTSVYLDKIKLNKLEQSLIGKEITMRRVMKIEDTVKPEELIEYEIQIIVKEIDWKKATDTYAVLGKDLREAINQIK